MTMAFTVHGVLISLFLLLRFLVVSPIAQLFPALRKRVAVYASALSMNIGYRRTPTGELLTKMRVWELFTLALWGSALFAMYRGFLPWRTLAVWYGVSAIASVVNTLRTLGAHHYESERCSMDRDGQLGIPSTRRGTCSPNCGLQLDCAITRFITTSPVFLITIWMRLTVDCYRSSDASSISHDTQVQPAEFAENLFARVGLTAGRNSHPVSNTVRR